MASASTPVDRDVSIAIIPGRARSPRRPGLAILLILSLAAAQAENPAPTAPTDYELPGPVETAALLPAKMIDSPAGRVAPQAMADGWHVTYTLEDADGTESLTGTQFLANRLREIRAITTLREMNKSEEFGKALLASGGEKIRSVASAVKDPVNTLQKLPKGASKFFGRLGTTAKNVAEGKVGATDAAEAALGVQRKRAELCLKLGVSPFTRDPVLRAELDTASRAMAAGATLVNFTGLIVGGGVGTALTVVNANQAFQRALVESTPAELAERNREILRKLGAEPEEVSAFLDNPAFNPWQKSAVTASLAAIGLPPGPVLARAAEATGDEDAVYFVQMARILEKHHTGTQRLAAIVAMNGIPCAIDRDGIVVVPVGSDLIRWTPALADRSAEFKDWAGRQKQVKSLLLATDGAVSDRAKGALAGLGIGVADKVLGPAE